MRASWRCFKCGTVSTLDRKGRGNYTFNKVDGKWRPTHHKGECPKETDMAAKKTTSKKTTTKKASGFKKSTSKKTTRKAATKKTTSKKTTRKAGGGIGSFVYAMLDKKSKDDAIVKAVAKTFPDSKFNDHPTSHLSWYKNQHAKRAA